jgi:hypothetical protein
LNYHKNLADSKTFKAIVTQIVDLLTVKPIVVEVDNNDDEEDEIDDPYH